ncbi:MAG: type III-A CRISPR-associated RAMP protein Csm4 [Lachnospiraceae bacterium]|nr:type III-A CRISPR-associated RAMP protein Csm4 [Lachnospiraceae bacterium]
MEYKVYKLIFQGAVHFGLRNLEDGEGTFCADTLFSALFQEAVKMGEETRERLLRYVKNGELLFSDAFPFMRDVYYLPKPMKRVITKEEHGDSVKKKKFKKLKYIPVEDFGIYLQGKFDVDKTEVINELGDFQMKVSASVRGEEKTVPYRVGSYFFREGNGLYFIVGYRMTEGLELVESLLESLALVGIGGKRTSGMGKFRLDFGKMPEELQKRLKGEGGTYMTLSLSLPREDELSEALDGAEYLLSKRSGFVDSVGYADKQQRKRDLYVLRAGACTKMKFQGDVYNVAGENGTHPVYRYAKPMFLEVEV